MNRYLKLAMQVGVTVMAAVVAVLQTRGHITSSDWVNCVILGLGAVAVLGAGELPSGVWSRTKTYVAAATAGAVVLQSVITNGVTPVEWMQIALAVFGALGVHVVPGPQVAALSETRTPSPDRNEPYAAPESSYGWYDKGGVLPTWTVNQVRATEGLDDTQEFSPVTVRRLGRKPPTNAPRIKLTANMIPAAAFTPPPAVDWYSRVPANSWGMDANDQLGCCTCAEVDHTTKARQVAAGNPEVASTEAEIVALYEVVGGYNPNNPSSDRGAVMQDVRDYWRKHGVTLGGKLDQLTLFAEVDHTNLDLVRWCVDRFGAVALGINFPDSAMQQFDDGKPWDVVAGAQIEGGHAVSLIGYDAQYAYVVTWGRVQPMTWAFFRTYTEEAWTDISNDWLNAQSGQDPLGEVAYALGEQFAQVTGKPNPFPAPAPQPAPSPAPSPAPAPGPAPSPVPAPAPSSLTADVIKWAQRVVGESWRSKIDRRVAQEILNFASGQ